MIMIKVLKKYNYQMEQYNEWHDGSIVNLNLFWHFFGISALPDRTREKKQNKTKKTSYHMVYIAMASREKKGKKMSDANVDTNRRMCIP